MTTLTEADVEHAAHGPDIASGTPVAERDDYGQIVLERRLRTRSALLRKLVPRPAGDNGV